MPVINRGTRTIVLIMVVLVFLGIAIAKIYYKRINDAEDPRVVEAKHLYKKYNELTVSGDNKTILATLDSIIVIYNRVPHYAQSFETGVMYNNIATVYLTLALQHHENEQLKQEYLDSTKKYIDISFNNYKNWSINYSELDEAAIIKRIKPEFENISSDKKVNDRYIQKRVKDIITAQQEINRRLSVVYTNQGIVLRHEKKYGEAIENYKQALELWEHNYTAENNINILLGRPIKKRNFIQRMFPPSKK